MKNWWQNEVVYQIYPKSFYDSNHDGIGDILGIIEKLDYLKKLGITMIWICPVYQSPMDDNGYDISDYENIHPDFGTLEDVDCLIEEAKKRNIKIIMDLVINHTSDEHQWFKEALASQDSPYRQYYIFKEGKNGHAPTNWRSVFGGSTWEKVPGEDNMYYFHSFYKKQPDLNWENPNMRHDLYGMINRWLDKGIAGFRVDAINFIKKDQRYLDGEPDGQDGLVSCFDYCRNQEGIDVFFKELKSETFAKHQCMTVSEAVDVDYPDVGDYIGKYGCFSMMFDFNYTNIDVENEDVFKRVDWTIKEYKQLLYKSQLEIQKIGWSAPFLENHDQPRSINKLIKNPQYHNRIGATFLATMYFFLRGTPFIYQGQELGMINFQRKSIDEFDDINAHAQFLRALEEGFSEQQAITFLNMRSRDNARTPFPWSDAQYGGFSQHVPWIKMDDHFKQINAANQINRSDSVLSYYQKMISIRQHSTYHETLVYGAFDVLNLDNENIISYLRYDENQKIAIICNFSEQIQKIEYSFNINNIILNNEDNLQRNNQYIQLQPYQAIVLDIDI